MAGEVEQQHQDQDYRIKHEFCYGGAPHRWKGWKGWKGGPEIWRCEKCGLGVSGTRIVIPNDDV
jgi:hypothetical protein